MRRKDTRNKTSLLRWLALTGVVAAPAAGADGGLPPTMLEVVVDGAYTPSTLRVRSGEAARITFLKKDHSACTRELVFPTLGIRRVLPTGERVTIDLPADATGEIPFHCGMKMSKGRVLVEEYPVHETRLAAG